jgi:hypothetical protein
MGSQIHLNGSWIDVIISRQTRPPIVIPLPMSAKRLQPNKTDLEIRLPENLDVPPGIYQLREDGIIMEYHITSQRETVLFGVIN